MIAAEFPIYGRFGYGSAADHNVLKLEVARTCWVREAEGTVELVDEATARKEAPPVYERFRAQQPGAIGRDDRWWDIAFRIVKFPSFPISEKFWVLCRDRKGKVVGYASYTIDDHWVARRPENTVTIGELIGVDQEATLRLWQYVAEIDWVRTVSANDQSVDDPLHWQLVDGRALRAPTTAATSSGRARSMCPRCFRRAATRSSSGSCSRWSTTWATRAAGSRSTVDPTARPARRLAPVPRSRCRLRPSVRCRSVA